MADNDDVKIQDDMTARAREDNQPANDVAKEQDLIDSDSIGVEELQAELEEAKRQQEASLAQAQRLGADYANLKKRFEKEREELTSFAASTLLMRLLPAIDNLDRAVAFATEEDQKTSIFTGVKMTLQQLHGTMGQVGLKRMEVKPGDEFDPHIHEAVESVEGEANKVMEVLDSGYMIHEKVVRPARVKVGKG